MRKNLRVFLLVLAITIFLAACGGSDTINVSVNMREFSFSPDNFTVPAGAEVTLNFKNLGALGHNFHIMMVEGEIVETWDEGDESLAILNIEIVDGGDNTSTTFTAPDSPGTYQFLCSIPGHLEQGMIGTMTVTSP